MKGVSKFYLAEVQGDFRPDLPQKNGWSVFSAKLAVIKGDGPLRATISDQGKYSETHFMSLERGEFGGAAKRGDERRIKTLVLCRLVTGYTHQIRVHLQSLGHPIVGDDLYAVQQEAQPKSYAIISSTATSETAEVCDMCDALRNAELGVELASGGEEGTHHQLVALVDSNYQIHLHAFAYAMSQGVQLKLGLADNCKNEEFGEEQHATCIVGPYPRWLGKWKPCTVEDARQHLDWPQ
eukprot:Platyproteum_vivax@DN1723_c0_g1_i1.p1